jgi:hypothetical protein
VLAESRFVDETAAGAVHKRRAALHEADPPRVQEIARVGRERQVQRHDIGRGAEMRPTCLPASLRCTPRPSWPIVALTGDGGCLMAIAEIQKSVREKLPIIVVVVDDEEIGLVRVKQ